MKLRTGDYGIVRVTSGEHVGRIGYYDDESDDGRGAIVYFKEPLTGAYDVIAFKHLEHVDISSLDVERFRRDHPDLAKAAGI
jgi:hypothetical protein